MADPVAEEKRRRDAEEARQAELRRHGQPVTPEAFVAWKAAFDAEQALERAKLQGKDAAEESKGLTGKQFFLQQEAQHIEVRAWGGAMRAGRGAGSSCAWLCMPAHCHQEQPGPASPTHPLNPPSSTHPHPG